MHCSKRRLRELTHVIVIESDYRDVLRDAQTLLLDCLDRTDGDSIRCGIDCSRDDISFEHKQECKNPTDLTVLQLGSNHAVLNWNGVDSAGSFLVQVSTDPFFSKDEDMVFNEEVNTNTCTVKGLKPQTTSRSRATPESGWTQSGALPAAWRRSGA